jgi:hypothetical protein
VLGQPQEAKDPSWSDQYEYELPYELQAFACKQNIGGDIQILVVAKLGVEQHSDSTVVGGLDSRPSGDFSFHF